MKQKNKKVVEVKSIDKNVAVCQNCKLHNNNPSFCRKKKEFVARKGTCDGFK